MQDAWAPSGREPADAPRVVVGVDGSETSRVALVRAAREARAHGARLEIVHAWTYLEQHGSAFDPRFDERSARAYVEDIVAATLDDDPNLLSEVRLVNDHAPTALVEASVGALTVVVGARGRGAFKAALLGSVSGHVVHHGACPVLVVR